MIKLQQSQALTSHFESFCSIVHCLEKSTADAVRHMPTYAPPMATSQISKNRQRSFPHSVANCFSEFDRSPAKGHKQACVSQHGVGFSHIFSKV